MWKLCLRQSSLINKILTFPLPLFRILQNLLSHYLTLTQKVGSLLTLQIRKFLTWKKSALAVKQDPFMLKVECKLSPILGTLRGKTKLSLVLKMLIAHMCITSVLSPFFPLLDGLLTSRSSFVENSTFQRKGNTNAFLTGEDRLI